MDLWFTEFQTKNVGITLKTTRTLYHEQSEFQDIAIIDTVEFGRMLALDGLVQTTVRDEYIYHEMIAHVPLFTHPAPRRVLVVGGGDGGTIREVVKHPVLEEAVMVEIDGKVVEACRQFLPETSSSLSDPRVVLKIDDGIRHVKESETCYDVIIIDSSEPIGPGAGLFTRDFYQSVYRALKDDGLMVAQTESPFFNADLIRDVYRSMRDVFPIARVYMAPVPTYPGGLWTFTIGSKKYDPVAPPRVDAPLPATRYYNREVHAGSFMLPKLVADLLAP